MEGALTKMDAYYLMHEGILALSRAEQQGFRVDLEYAERKKVHLSRKIEKLEEQFRETQLYRHWEHSFRGKVNINSNAQLANFLYKVKKLSPVAFTDSGMGSTDEESLQALDLPELDLLLEARKLRKVRDVYLDAFVRESVDGYIHPFFNLHLVRTFRSSSSNPNFQNIPKRDEAAMELCRRALYPRPGHQLMEVDFSGMEVRVACCYHKDPTMVHYMTEPASDMHMDMAMQLFGFGKKDKELPGVDVLRQASKNAFVFAQFYGDYYRHCAEGLVCGWGKLRKERWSRGQGIEVLGTHLSDHLIDRGFSCFEDYVKHVQKIEDHFWKVRFPVYAQWREDWVKEYFRKGYMDTLTGFRCSGEMERNNIINYPVQGSAFHCLLWCFIQVDKWLHANGLRTRLIGQIHDSMILDVHPAELEKVSRRIYQITSQELAHAWPWIIVPMRVDAEICPVDGSWVEKEKYKFCV